MFRQGSKARGYLGQLGGGFALNYTHSSFDEKIKGYFRFARGISQLLRVCRPSSPLGTALLSVHVHISTSSVKERQKKFCEGIFKRAKRTRRLSIFFYYNFPRLFRSRFLGGLLVFPRRFTRRNVFSYFEGKMRGIEAG